jgi:H+-transporting ATPase
MLTVDALSVASEVARTVGLTGIRRIAALKQAGPSGGDAAALLLLAIGWPRFGLAANAAARSTFSFLVLLAFAIFSILSARERRRFWATRPGNALLMALAADAIVGLVLASVNLPGLEPLPWQAVVAVFGYAALCCLVVNDTLKIALLARFVPSEST